MHESDAAQPVKIPNVQNVSRHHRIYVDVVAVNVGLRKRHYFIVRISRIVTDPFDARNDE